MKSILRRYTNLASVIHLLTSKQITLLSPASWDDKNDAYYMAEYKRLKGAQTVLALCFTQHAETYHHWRVFAPGADGVCVEFDKTRLLPIFEADPRIRADDVEYRLIGDVRRRPIRLPDLPFLKRKPFAVEREFRVIFSDETIAREKIELPLDLQCIRRVVLSPWMPRCVADSVKQVLRSIDGTKMLELTRSSLVDNAAWKSATSRFKK